MGKSLHQSGSSSHPPEASYSQRQVRVQNAQMTKARELLVRDDDDCQKESQRASEAIRQASQQASQLVQQASQQASQASREATQSADQAIQQAQLTASQSIAEISISASSVQSSANSLVSSVRASADSAILRANLAIQTAQLSASVAQSEASKAVLAAQQTGEAAASQLAHTSPITTSLPGATITGAHLALVIVGSVIASSLITIIAYFLILRHKRLSRAARPESLGDGSNDNLDDLKFPDSGGVTTTIKSSKPAYTAGRDDPPPSPLVTYSIFPRSSIKKTSMGQKASADNTALPKIPTDAPKSQSLRSWLRRRDKVSSFGPLQLPTTGSKGPLGGQLKSPLRKPPARFILDVSTNKELAGDVSTPVPPSTLKNDSGNHQSSSPKMSGAFPDPSIGELYREIKASVWTDAITDDGSVMSSAPLAGPVSGAIGTMLSMPPSKKPVRNTAEWLMDRENFRDFSPDVNSPNSKQSVDSRDSPKPSFGGGLLRNLRGSSIASRQEPEPHQQGNGAKESNELLDAKDKSQSGKDGDKPNMPGIGKAM